MKQRFSSLDVKVIAYELSKVLLSLRIANIYDLSSRIFLLKLAKPGTRQQLLIDTGFRCHLTSFVRTTAAAPSHFVSRLRKYLKSRRVTAVSQVGSDRVIEVVFSDGQYRLFLEFFAAGNIILTDKEFNILALFRNVSEGNEEVDVKLGGSYPLAAKQNYGGAQPVTELRIKNTLEDLVSHTEATKVVSSRKAKSKGADDLKKGFAGVFPEYPVHLLDHAFIQTSFDSTTKPAQVLEDAGLLSELVGAVRLSERISNSLCQAEEPKGYIVAKLKETFDTDDAVDTQETQIPRRDKLLYEDFHPFKPSQYEGKSGMFIIEIDGFNRTVDEFYSSLESQKLESRLSEREENARKKIDMARKQHESRIGALQQVQEIHIRKAEAIEANTHRIEEVIAAVNGLIGQGMDWMDIAKLIENEQGGENVVAQMIKLPLKLYENNVTVLLDEASIDGEADNEGYETNDSSATDDGDEDDDSHSKKPSSTEKKLTIDIDLGLSAWANARQYHDQKKTAAQKEQKTLQASSKALKSTEQKINSDMKKGLKQEKEVLRPARQQFWFEKFWYFISSDGYLVVGGKDVQQNELLYRRYLKKGDAFVHADLQSATSLIVKNTAGTPDAPIPPSTLSQAGSLSVCTSTAWDSKAVMAAWWVYAHQVSKTAPTGEYLSGSGFIIKGERNFLPPAQLLLGFSVVFCISEESQANHTKHRVRDFNQGRVGDALDDAHVQIERAEQGNAVRRLDHDAELGANQAGQLQNDAQDSVSDASIHDLEEDDPEEDAQDGHPETDSDTRSEDHIEAVNPLQSRISHSQQQLTDSSESELEASTADIGEEEVVGSQSENEPTKKVEAQSGESLEDTEEPQNLVTASVPSSSIHDSRSQDLPTQSSSPNTKGSARRGKNTKASRRAMAKYAHQDPEERALAQEILGSNKLQEKKEAIEISKAARDAKSAADKERRRAQHDRAAAAEKRRTERLEREEASGQRTRPPGEAVDEDDAEDSQLHEQEQSSLPSTLRSLITNPMPSDQILFALPHIAPWSALSSAKYKVKLQPGGSLKKGKAVREIVGRWLEMAKVGGARVVDVDARDRDKVWPAEVEAIKAWRLEEVFGCLPVGRVRVMFGVGGGKGNAKAKTGGVGGAKGGKAKATKKKK